MRRNDTENGSDVTLDPSAVTEALDAWVRSGEDDAPSLDFAEHVELTDTLAAAARSWVEGIETGYCVTHRCTLGRGLSQRCEYAHWRYQPNDPENSCTIVSEAAL